MDIYSCIIVLPKNQPNYINKAGFEKPIKVLMVKENLVT